MKVIKYLSVFLLTVFFLAEVMSAKGVEGERRSGTAALRKANGTPVYTHFNINQVSTWIKNNGETDINPNGNSGFEYPKGSNHQAVFQSGLVWGAEVDGELRVGGSTYRQGLLPGAVDLSRPTKREDDAAEHVRIYRVRPDYKTGNMTYEVLAGDADNEADARAQYELDWNNWPASYGAPYEDVDTNGSYSPTIDIPGIPGADQTVWFVANDMDDDQALFIYGAHSIGLEMQETVWGYDRTGALGNMLFRKFTVINYSGKDLTNAYFAWWSDPDNGGAGDDYVGCDTTLSLGFCYNGAASDGQYGLTPPATGYDFFQGPWVAGNEDDVSIFNLQKRKGRKNLGMTSFFFFINGDAVYNDPDLGDYQNGTLQMYNLFEGKVSTTGVPFTDPLTNKSTKFALAGDPVAGTGWIDGILHPPADRRLGLASGPFVLGIGDTQEVVLAEMAGGAFGTVDRLGALQLVKFYDKEAQITYDNLFNVPSPPAKPIVKSDGLDQEILLSWYQDDASVQTIENYTDLGFEFQGYVVYQFPSAASSLQDANIVATYDLKDGKGKILGDAFDVKGGVVTKQVLKFGSDSGIRRSISIVTDALNSNLRLNNGSKYYFAITSYAVHSNPLNVPLVLESPIEIFEVTPQKPDPGMNIPLGTSAAITATHSKGTANATVEVNVVNPTETSGHDYYVYFNQQHYYLDSDGQWKKTNYPDSIGKALGKDVSGSSLTGTSYISGATTRDLVFNLNLVAPDYSYADGLVLTFPSGTVIDGAEDAGDNHAVSPVIDLAANTVTWGSPDTTENGPFKGGEEITVHVSGNISLPLTVDWLLWDDGWGFINMPNYGLTGEYKHGTGTVTITEEKNYFKTVQHWNLHDVTTDVDVLEDQTLMSPDSYEKAASTVVDGIQTYVTGGYAAPVDFLSYTVYRDGYSYDGVARGYSTSRTPYALSSYLTPYGWAATAKSADAFGDGETSVDILQKDYELRFTGVYEDAVDAKGVLNIKDGTGSIATIYNARGSGMGGGANHPMNPNPGSDASFTVRIPFEIWNIDDNKQVNVVMVDRKQAFDANPFYAFNPNDRMYVEILNTDYSESVQDVENDASISAHLTWNLVFWKTQWETGDVVKIEYANPIQLGKDEFDFSVPGPTYSADLAKADVENINVFPNPYYGFNTQEINKYQRFVTFSHLPNNATIRIFNLAGQLLKTITKASSSQFERWDLTNEAGLPAASGLYIAYIELPDLDKTKILKFSIIQEQQVLDRF